jgi:site-specific DNA-methyltransferase (cytosine-N4-specific)
MNKPVNEIICGDALAVLQTLPSDYVQCVVSSPPYYCQRDYGVEGQIGLEETPQEFIAKLVEVFREVRRVLRPDGVCWINMGDKFANDTKWGESTSGKHAQELHGMNSTRDRRHTGFKPKDLMMIPARLAIALQDDGWYLRQDIIWHKITAMPDGVTDRPTSAHEHVFLLAKSERYFYDADAIREPLKDKTYTTFGIKHREQGNDALGLVKSDNWGRTVAERKPKLTLDGEIAGANKRSVWPIAARPYPDAHFATFPPKLVEPMILAGSAPRACEHCGTCWQRVSIPTGHINKREQAHVPYTNPTKNDSTGRAPSRRVTDQWMPSCKCKNNTGSGKCIILDPFMGAGTTAMVALQHSRDYLGIELNTDYIELALRRIGTIQPTLWSGVGESESA